MFVVLSDTQYIVVKACKYDCVRFKKLNLFITFFFTQQTFFQSKVICQMETLTSVEAVQHPSVILKMHRDIARPSMGLGDRCCMPVTDALM